MAPSEDPAEVTPVHAEVHCGNLRCFNALKGFWGEVQNHLTSLQGRFLATVGFQNVGI